MGLIKRFTSWILYTSFFAALCAVSLCIGTERLLIARFPPLFTPLHAFILGCTMMVYNAHFLIKKSRPQISDRYQWTEQHRIWHYIIFISGFLFSVISIFFLSWKILIACIVLGALSFTYTLPLLPFARTRLRDFGWVKILTLTLVWTIVTSALPILFWGKSLIDYPFEILQRFVFMFVLCVAFDIRDMQTDLKSNIFTLPNIVGIKNSYRIMDGAILLFLLLSFIQYMRYPFTGRFTGEIIAAVCTKIAIEFSKKRSSDKIYLGIIDGMMLLYGCLVTFFSHYK